MNISGQQYTQKTRKDLINSHILYINFQKQAILSSKEKIYMENTQGKKHFPFPILGLFLGKTFLVFSSDPLPGNPPNVWII